MPKYYKKEDVEYYFEEKIRPQKPYLTINEVMRHFEEVPSVDALELNEDLELMLKQLGYEKIVYCKECKNRFNRKWCPYAEFKWLDKTEVPDSFYCRNGEKKDG